MGTIDLVPSATLLFPYFEVNLAGASGVTTILFVQNSSVTPTIAHLTLWTDAAVPTYAIDIFLAGYDVQPINLRDVFISGPAWLEDAHTGLSSAVFSGLCAGFDHGDAIARGYVTVDAVSVTTAADVFPGSAGYFEAGGVGIATNNNVLSGEFAFVDLANNFAQSETAVHIEADARYGAPGVYTFYGREVLGTGIDNREPLPTVLSVNVTTELTSLVAWRDTGVPGTPFVCGTSPSWFPMTQDQIVAFDTETNPDFSGQVVAPFSNAVTRTTVGGPFFRVDIAKAGWLYLNLNEDWDLAGAPFGRLRQAWVFSVTQDEDLGRFSHGANAVQLRNASEESPPPGKLGAIGGAR
jgi:hypothetical protein